MAFIVVPMQFNCNTKKNGAIYPKYKPRNRDYQKDNLDVTLILFSLL